MYVVIYVWFLCLTAYHPSWVLYSLHNELVLLHKHTSTGASDKSAPIIVLVHLSSCWVTFRPAVLYTAQFRSGVPQPWRSLWPQGFNPLWSGWVNCLAPEAPLFKENADGARGIFGTAGRVWATAPRQDPP